MKRKPIAVQISNGELGQAPGFVFNVIYYVGISVFISWYMASMSSANIQW